MKGRYGPYVTDGNLNATLPRDSDPLSVTVEDAVALLAARAEKGPGKKKRGAKKATPAATPKTPAAKKTPAPKKAKVVAGAAKTVAKPKRNPKK